jgi:DNA modification methylase
LLIQGDFLANIPLADGSVHCVFTSPPYWGLRKYEGDQGDAPLGEEATIDEHVRRLVEGFREVRRVLRDDGVFLLNYSDAHTGVGRGVQSASKRSKNWQPEYERVDAGVPGGNLMLLPARIALALQADGWMLRQSVIWNKPNPLPENVGGWRWELESGRLRQASWRPTSSYEFVFLFSKGLSYWGDQEAVRETALWAHDSRAGRGHVDYDGKRTDDPDAIQRGFVSIDRAGKNPRSVMEIPDPRDLPELWSAFVETMTNPPAILTIPTASYKASHSATFPPDLVAFFVKALCPRWCCPTCGRGWAPIVSRSMPRPRPDNPNPAVPYTANSGHTNATGTTTLHMERVTTVHGYRPTCGCHAGLEVDDLETIASPTGTGGTEDPTEATGRRGLNRLRNVDEGVRLITRFEQRRYAEQIKKSPQLEAMKDEAGSAIEHYVRTDRAGARPVPAELLESWIERGWLERVAVPAWPDQADAVPGIVFDPMVGSGTTVMVAQQLLRRGIGMDISRPYLSEQATIRTGFSGPTGQLDGLPMFDNADTG